MPEDAQETQLLDTEQQTSSATKKKKPSLATEQRYTQQLATWGESRATSNIVSPAHLAHCKMLRGGDDGFLGLDKQSFLLANFCSSKTLASG